MFREYVYNLYNLYKSELSDLYTLYTSPPEIGLNTRLSSRSRARNAAAVIRPPLTLKQVISGPLLLSNGYTPKNPHEGIIEGKRIENRDRGRLARGTPQPPPAAIYGPIPGMTDTANSGEFYER